MEHSYFPNCKRVGLKNSKLTVGEFARKYLIIENRKSFKFLLCQISKLNHSCWIKFLSFLNYLKELNRKKYFNCILKLWNEKLIKGYYTLF